MGSKTEDNDSSQASNVKTTRTNVPWVTDEYDDEKLLLDLRAAHPQSQWADIRSQFNNLVPPERHRTMNGLTLKAKALRKVNASVASLGIRNEDEMDQNPSLQMTDRETLLQLEQWDGVPDNEGYLALIAEQSENLEIARMIAMEAASGMSYAKRFS